MHVQVGIVILLIIVLGTTAAFFTEQITVTGIFGDGGLADAIAEVEEKAEAKHQFLLSQVRFYCCVLD